MIWLILIAFLPILAFGLGAFLGFRGDRDGNELRLVPLSGIAALVAALGTALGLWLWGSPVSSAFSPLRIDLVSVTLLVLISFLGAIIQRFSLTYLDREAGQGRFMGYISLTLAAVSCLVMSGHLLLLVAAWILTSVFLHKLLLFYPERPGAQRAARKKFIMARAGDAALIAAAALLWTAYGTGNIGTIIGEAREGIGGGMAIAAASFIALAALLKSAQFPTHGWLTEVMETPTPVSALLHAGVINAGGFLLIRFADVMLLAPGALAGLALVGGFTALFGGLVMLTQPAVKTSLAWSTVAQMGFMIFQCGLALFPLALLHIVAHSLYKAHAFLSAGSAIKQVASIRKPGPIAVPGASAVLRAFAAALVIYAGVGFLFGFADKSPQAIVLGAILIFGVAYLLAQGFADQAPRMLTRYTAIMSLAAATAYFALQTGAQWLLAGTVPATPSPGPLEWVLMVIAVLSFGLVAIAQATFPLWSHHPAAAGLRVHLSNGLYINAITDRLLRNASLGAKA